MPIAPQCPLCLEPQDACDSLGMCEMSVPRAAIKKEGAINLQQILTESPDCPGYGGGKWAMYGVGCCWWTSFPEDLGNTKPFNYKIKHKDGTQITVRESPGLPCCPYCGSMLMQAPLDLFVESATETPDHYGENGLDTFIAAHSRNAKTCFKQWSLYRFVK